jgi:hypothetical protein
MPMWPPLWRDKYAWFEGPSGWQDQVRTARWQEEQDDVVYDSLVEPRNQVWARVTVDTKSWVGFAWRSHQVYGVCSGSQQNQWVHWLIHKAKTEDRSVCNWLHWAGLTVGDTSLTSGCRGLLETPKRRTHDMIARLACRWSGLAVDVHPSDGVSYYYVIGVF